MWTIEMIEQCGFTLLQNDKLWCRFRRGGWEVMINLDTKVVDGNHFNFHSIPSRGCRGHFKAKLYCKEELVFLTTILDDRHHCQVDREMKAKLAFERGQAVKSKILNRPKQIYVTQDLNNGQVYAAFSNKVAAEEESKLTATRIEPIKLFN